MENIVKFQQVVKFYKLDRDSLRDLVLALSLSDFVYGDNDMKLDVDRACSTQDSSWAELVYFLGLKQVDHSEVLPYVQRLRLLCDTLLIALEYEGIPILSSEFVLTMPQSLRVAKLKVMELNRMSSCDEGYADERVCISVLDKLMESIVFEDIVSIELKETFEYIQSVLERMSRIDKRSKKGVIFGSRDFSSVYLPSEYESFGYNVSNDIPARLNPSRNFNDFYFYVKLTFIREVVDSVVHHFIDGDNSNFGVAALLFSLEDLRFRAKDILPVGISCNVSEVKSISIPYYSNKVAKQYISSVFSGDEATPLSEQSLDQVLGLLVIKYPEVEV